MKQFYKFNDLLGKNNLELEKEYIADVKQYQSAKKALIAGEKPSGYHDSSDEKRPILNSLGNTDQLTFEEIYKNISNPDIEIESTEEIKKINEIEVKIKEGKDCIMNELPLYLKCLQESKKKIVQKLIERKEALDYMNEMCSLMRNADAKMFDESEIDNMDQVSEMAKFYEHFTTRLTNVMFPELKTEKKRPITDYFESSHRSSIMNIGFNKRKSERSDCVSNEGKVEMVNVELDSRFKSELKVNKQEDENVINNDWEEDINGGPEDDFEIDFEERDHSSPESGNVGIINKVYDRNSVNKSHLKEKSDLSGKVVEDSKRRGRKSGKRDRTRSKSASPNLSKLDDDQYNDMRLELSDTNIEVNKNQTKDSQDPSKMKRRVMKKLKGSSKEKSRISKTKSRLSREPESEIKTDKLKHSSDEKVASKNKKTSLKESLQKMQSRRIKENDLEVVREVEKQTKAKNKDLESSQRMQTISSSRNETLVNKKGQEDMRSKSSSSKTKPTNNIKYKRNINKPIESDEDDHIRNEEISNHKLLPLKESRDKHTKKKIRKTVHFDNVRPRISSSSSHKSSNQEDEIRDKHGENGTSKDDSEQEDENQPRHKKNTKIPLKKQKKEVRKPSSSQKGFKPDPKEEEKNSRKQAPLKASGIHQSREKEVLEDMPPLLKEIDASRYENQIYTTKKRRMYIAIKDFRLNDKNYYNLRQGDVVCCVTSTKGWYLVYSEENPKKYGFCPGNYLNIIQ